MLQSNPELLNSAVGAFNGGRHVEALSYLDEIEVPPVHVAGYRELAEHVFFLRGAVIAALGKTFLAVDNLRKAYELNPRRIDVCERLGDLLVAAGDLVDGVYFKNKARELNKFSNNEDIIVIGDSHSDFLFSGIPRCKICWLGPATMHRVGRDGVDVLGLDLIKIPLEARIVLAFGEIDVRAHIGKIVASTGMRPEEVIEDLCERYFSSISEIQNRCPSVLLALTSVVPPFRILQNPNFPSVGSVAERALYAKMLNERLATGCAERGWSFLNVSRYFSNPGGAMYFEYSDGNCHVRREFSDVANYELGLAFGF